jgi:hypothetical protein
MRAQIESKFLRKRKMAATKRIIFHHWAPAGDMFDQRTGVCSGISGRSAPAEPLAARRVLRQTESVDGGNEWTGHWRSRSTT